MFVHVDSMRSPKSVGKAIAPSRHLHAEDGAPVRRSPLVGTAWLLKQEGPAPSVLRPPAGEVPIRIEGDATFVSGRSEWAPPFEHIELASPAEVYKLEGPPDGVSTLWGCGLGRTKTPAYCVLECLRRGWEYKRTKPQEPTPSGSPPG